MTISQSLFLLLSDHLSICLHIFSCGVILYILLCGWPPFHGESTQQIFKNIVTQPLDLKSDPWHKISAAAKDCVKVRVYGGTGERGKKGEGIRKEAGEGQSWR